MAEEPAPVEEDSRRAETADGRQSRQVNLSQLPLMHAACQVAVLFGVIIVYFSPEMWGLELLLNRYSRELCGAFGVTGLYQRSIGDRGWSPSVRLAHFSL